MGKRLISELGKFRYVPVKDEKTLKECGVPFSCRTLYKWHHEKRCPQIFKKVFGTLFLDLEEYFRLFEEGGHE